MLLQLQQQRKQSLLGNCATLFDKDTEDPYIVSFSDGFFDTVQNGQEWGRADKVNRKQNSFGMDTLLCDELLQEILHRLPPSSSAAVSLVSKRWCRLLRSSTTSLSLQFSTPCNPTTITSFFTFLSHHPFLSSISLAGGGFDGAESLLLAVASSCSNVRHLRYLTSPVPSFSLHTLSASCIHLSSLAVSISRPLYLDWLRYFTSLKCLSLFLCGPFAESADLEVKQMEDGVFDLEVSLESLSLCGVLSCDSGISYLWRNCRNLKKLQLKNCESVGDYNSFSSLLKLLNCLQEVELRTCRSIVNDVLLILAENCVSLDSLLVYDGGSKEGLLQFINQSKCNLRRIDLRLPLDLDNSHLISLAQNLNYRILISLRLESCCLITGEGLKAVAMELGNGLEELALINCDVVERESGFLADLGQHLKSLKKLDLSGNDMLLDKELVAMLVSCNCLDELRVRGCKKLTNMAVDSMVRSCKQLQSVDVTSCGRIDMEGVERLVRSSLFLRRVEVEESKLSEVARMLAMSTCIEVVS